MCKVVENYGVVVGINNGKISGVTLSSFSINFNSNVTNFGSIVGKNTGTMKDCSTHDLSFSLSNGVHLEYFGINVGSSEG